MTDTEYTADNPLTAWRSWILFGSPPRIASIFSTNRDRLWFDGRARDALCIMSSGAQLAYPWDQIPGSGRIGHSMPPHDVPDPECTCGHRAMRTLESLVTDVRDGGPATREMWYGMGRDIWRFRCETASENLPDVIGLIDLWGRMEGVAKGDPAETIRAQYGRIGKRLYLGWHVGRAADEIRRLYPSAEIIVSTTPGAEWLDEIAEAEGVTA